MTIGRHLTSIVFGGLLVSWIVGGCGSKKSTSCPEGNERCACYANRTCDDGLECHSGVCVASSGGSGSVGGEGGEAGANVVGGNGGAGGDVEGGSESGGKSTATNNPKGGTNAKGGATSSTGGTTSSATSSTGGITSNTGGTTSSATSSTGGTTSSTGGTTSSTGGTTSSTGGTTNSTGGTTSSTGGTTSSTGGTTSSTGGTTSSTGGTTGSGQLGPNQIANGDFSQGTTYWHVSNGSGYEILTGTISTEGAYCIGSYYSSTYGSTQIIGWPLASAQALNLRYGYTYSLTFRLIATTSANVAVKVGYFATPYSIIYQAVTTSAIPTTWKEYLHTFKVTGTGVTTPLAGLAFTITGFTSGQVCLDDVVLAQVL